MTKKLEIRASGEVGFVDGYMMAVVYPVAECEQSTDERDFNVKRMIDSWNNYDALQSLNAELLSALEKIKFRLDVYLDDERDMPESSMQVCLYYAEKALAKARSQS